MTQRNAGIDLLRAWAIALTVLMHYTWLAASILLKRDIERDALSDAQSVGHFVAVWLFHSQHGVYLFFVISGYLITQGLLRNPTQSPLRFLRNRAWRLLPCLWVALSASLLINEIHGSPRLSLPAILANFFTVNWAFPKDIGHILTVTWSLFWEWVFYLCAALALCSARSTSSVGKFVFVCLIAATVSMALFAIGGRAWTYLFLFATGAAVAYSPRLREKLLAIGWPVVAVYHFLVVTTYAWFAPAHDATQSARFAGGLSPHDLYAPLFSIAAAWLIAFFAKRDLPVGRQRGLRAAALWLGERSYSIYLWHMPGIIGLAWFGSPTVAVSASLPVPVVATALLLVFASLLTAAFAEISYRFLELPYLRRSGS